VRRSLMAHSSVCDISLLDPKASDQPMGTMRLPINKEVTEAR
jgi:hypothetical protein